MPDVLHAPLALLVASELHALLRFVHCAHSASIRVHGMRRHGYWHRERRGQAIDLALPAHLLYMALLLFADCCSLGGSFGFLASTFLLGVVLRLEAVVWVHTLVLFFLLVHKFSLSFKKYV